MTWVFVFQKRKEKKYYTFKTYIFVKLFNQDEAKDKNNMKMQQLKRNGWNNYQRGIFLNNYFWNPHSIVFIS